MDSDEERLWKPVGGDEVVYDGWLKIHRRTYLPPDGRTAGRPDGRVGHACSRTGGDCEPVVMEVEAVRAGRMTGSEQAYLALDHAGLL